MKRSRVLLMAGAVLLLLTPISRSATPQSEAAFQKLKALAGNWEGNDTQGHPGKTTFKLAASGTAVMETLSPPGMEEMVSLYSVDQDSIAMIHFCPTNNQPHMKATPGPGEIKELTFNFLSVDNLASPQAGHQHKLVLRFDDVDHITEFWTWRQNGKDIPMEFHFTRKKG